MMQMLSIGEILLHKLAKISQIGAILKKSHVYLFVFFILTPFCVAQNKIIELPGLKIFLQEKKIIAQGVVNQTTGPVELLATTMTGKRHESVLVLYCFPHILQSALLLIGANPGGGGTFQGDTVTPFGDPIYLYVEWKDGNAVKRMPAEKLLWNCKYSATMNKTHWVFTGSRLRKNPHGVVFAANEQGLLIATYYDPDSIINNPLPERVDDTMYEANSNVLPSKGTEVSVIFSVTSLE